MLWNCLIMYSLGDFGSTNQRAVILAGIWKESINKWLCNKPPSISSSEKHTVYFRGYINKCCYSVNKLWLPWNIFEFHRKQRYPVKRKWRKCQLGCKTPSVSTLRFWLKLSIGGTALREIRRENTLLTGAVYVGWVSSNFTGTGYEKSDDIRLVKRVISLRGKVYFWICQVARVANKLACVQTSPISFVAHGKGPFCACDKRNRERLHAGNNKLLRETRGLRMGAGKKRRCRVSCPPGSPPPRHARLRETNQWYEDWQFLVNLG